MEQLKTYKVAMLPTEKVSNLVQISSTNELHYMNHLIMTFPDSLRKRQHIYITSDEKIKVGDLVVYDNGLNSPGFVIKAVIERPNQIVYRQINETWEDYGHIDGGITPLLKNVRKIIATTDSSLMEITVPKNSNPIFLNEIYPIPEAFIKDYTKAYNEGNPIREVQLEYYGGCCGRCIDGLDECIPTEPKLKLNPDNTIIIHSNKALFFDENKVNDLIKDNNGIESKNEIHNISACMLSILDSLMLNDNGLQDNSEPLSKMMFRKMEAYNVDLNQLLGFKHLKPVEEIKHKPYNKEYNKEYSIEEVNVLFNRFTEFIAHNEPQEWGKWIKETLAK